ncbi:unknown protein [Nostoc sp. NIES-3756]|jgi:hypothetical protein|uniref:hypothetical protein n=1 Tax=Nostoc sp. NIES-3756 TaxID=1751286 RepID=UPI00072214B5|nr:hypothetical protein [Nostoc sp. NIES-3756]BAT53374.1 unknown protein [Nostoc sp. NIES-3756]BAY38890.1 hypothetical protein NIES2111_32390 [Nostoc sp. NIES-2111]
MPGGHASHKGTGAKPNINSNGVIGEAADQSLEPEDLLPEELTTTETLRTDEYVDFPPATQRPDKKAE